MAPRSRPTPPAAAPAERRPEVFRRGLTPLFFAVLAVLIGVVAASLFLPLVRLMSALT